MKTKHTTETITDIVQMFYFSEISVDFADFSFDYQKVLYLLGYIGKKYPINSIAIDRNVIVSGNDILVFLLRCFVHPSKRLDVINFDIYYDLIQKEFIVTEKPSDTQIALYSLIHTRDYFDWQRKMQSKDNFEVMLNEYDRIGTIFSKYDIQIIKLIGASEEDIKAIKAILG